MWELDHKESWAPKNWCFWTVVLEKTPESPRTSRRSNQSILKEIRPEYSLKELMLSLKHQYFGHLMWRADSLEKTDSVKDWRQEEEGTTEDEMVGWHHRLHGHELEQYSRIWWRTGKPCVLQSTGSQRVRHDWVTEQQITDLLQRLSPVYVPFGEDTLAGSNTKKCLVSFLIKRLFDAIDR